MANCFPSAELFHKHYFRFVPEVMALLAVMQEVKSLSGNGDRMSGVNTGSDLMSAKSH